LAEFSEVPIYLYWPFLISVACTLGGLPLIYWFVVRPFDRLLEKRSVTLEQGVFFVSALLRAANYSRKIAFKNKSNSYDDSLYGDFDFKEQASKLQFALSYTYLVMCNSMIALATIVMIYRWL